MRPASVSGVASAVGPALLLCAIVAGLPAQAQSAGRLCRVHFEEISTGGDGLSTQGTIEITTAAPQADGSGYFMGSGFAEVVVSPGRGCQVVSGSPHTTLYDAIVSSEGGTAEVDIFGAEADFPIEVQCGPMRSEYRMGLSAPPTVSMPLQDGANASYTETHQSQTFASLRVDGTVTLEFCTGR